MNKKTKDSMAVRQHMEAASSAAEAYYQEDDENRAILQILVERKNEKDAGRTGVTCMGYGKLLTAGIDNAIDNCEGFRNSLVLALGRRNPLLGTFLMREFSDSNKSEE